MKLIEKTWLMYGLFDCFYPGSERLTCLYNFFLYQDLYSEFQQLISLESLKNPIFRLISSISYENLLIFNKENHDKLPKIGLLLGDIYHKSLLGIDYASEFNEMQRKYMFLSEKGHNWIRLCMINSAFLKEFTENHEKYSIFIENPLLLQRNIESSISMIKQIKALEVNYDVLRIIYDEDMKKALGKEYISNRFLKELMKKAGFLVFIGDETINIPYYKLLKWNLKANPLYIENKKNNIFSDHISNIHEISMKIEKNHIFSPIAYCYMKGYGVKINEIYSIAYYYKDLLNETNYVDLLKILYKITKLMKIPILYEICYMITIELLEEFPIISMFFLAKSYFKGKFVQIDIKHSHMLYSCILAYIHVTSIDDIFIKAACKRYTQEKSQENIEKIIKEEKYVSFLLISKLYIEKKPTVKQMFSIAKNEIFKYISAKNDVFIENIDINTYREENNAKERYKELIRLNTYENPACIGQYIEILKECLKKKLHFFEKNQFFIKVEEFSKKDEIYYKFEGFYGKILGNEQECFIRKIKLFLTNFEENEKIIKKITDFSRLSDRFCIAFFGFSLELIENLVILYLFYEPFQEISLKDINNKENIERIIEILEAFDNNNQFLYGFTPQNWVFQRKTLKFIDFSLNLIENKDNFTSKDIKKLTNKEEYMVFFSSDIENTFHLSHSLYSLGVFIYFAVSEHRTSKKITEKDIENNIKSEKNIAFFIKKLLFDEKPLDLVEIKKDIAKFYGDDEKQKIIKNKEFYINIPFLSKNGVYFLKDKGYYKGEVIDNMPIKGSFSNENISFKGNFIDGRVSEGELLDFDKQISFNGSFREDLIEKGVIQNILNEDIRLNFDKNTVFLNNDFFAKYLLFSSDFLETFNNFIEKDIFSLLSSYILFMNSINISSIPPKQTIESNELYEICSNPLIFILKIPSCFSLNNRFFLYNSKISLFYIFSYDNFSIGLYRISTTKDLIQLKQPFMGIRYSYFQHREEGVFLYNTLIKGNISSNMQNQRYFDISKEYYYGKLKNHEYSYVGGLNRYKRSGFGVTIYHKSGVIYRGIYRDDELNGKGIITTMDGKYIYKGVFKENMLDFGYFYHKNGNIYIGRFEVINDEKEGYFGELEGISLDYDKIYRNYRIYGYMNGYKGEYYCIDSSKSSFILKDDENVNGEYEIFYKNGGIYRGSLKNGYKNGYGGALYRSKRAIFNYISRFLEKYELKRSNIIFEKRENPEIC